MEPDWIRGDWRSVDKRDNVGKVIGWLRGEAKARPIVVDGRRAFAVINIRPFMSNTVHHDTRIDKVAQPVRVLTPDATSDAVLDAFADSLAPYLPVQGDNDPAGYVDPIDVLEHIVREEELVEMEARDAMRTVEFLHPGDKLSVAAERFAQLPAGDWAVEKGGRIVGSLPRRVLVRVQDRSDHAAGQFDRRAGEVDLWEEPVEGYMENRWGHVKPEAGFEEVVAALRDYGTVFVHGDVEGLITPSLVLRVLARQRATV